MFPIVSSFLFRHPMFLKTIGFSLYDANFYVEPFFRKAACSRLVLLEQRLFGNSFIGLIFFDIGSYLLILILFS